VVAAVSLAAGTVALSAGAPATADDANTLTVVGTSDVFDSNLVQTVLKPGFEAAHPGITLNYVSRGTGAAIAYAQAGTASALLVHAAALENQFVADGYSLEPYGRAIFWGDYVLLGPASDPAGVAATASHDIATAFEKIAAAGAAGTANFVSRGGTPGTTVQEHIIWALTNGVTKCDVSAANGGGQSPSTAAGACPSSIPYPAWYHATGLTQGPNILAGDTCNFPGGGCYVFTDRGTFNYLQSTGQIHSLGIVTRDNAATARGGEPLLVNSFHAYGINPAKFAGDPNVQINATAGKAFLDWITSPAAQAAVGSFLNASNDPPFIPSAAPKVTVTSTLPAKVKGGKGFEIKGNIANVVPGTPTLDGVTVRLMAVPTAHKNKLPVPVGGAKTDAKGDFTIKYKPVAGQTYSLETDQITKIEDSTLNPVFGDLLAPTSTKLSTVKVTGVVKLKKVEQSGKKLRLKGKLKPGTIDGKATLVLWAGRPGDKLRKISSHDLKVGKDAFDTKFTFGLKPGKWKVQLRYVDKRVVLTGKSNTLRVNIT